MKIEQLTQHFPNQRSDGSRVEGTKAAREGLLKSFLATIYPNSEPSQEQERRALLRINLPDTRVWLDRGEKDSLKKEVGKTLSETRLREIFGEDFSRFWEFVTVAKGTEFDRICVSRTAADRWGLDKNLLYFRVRDSKETKVTEVIFLGQGRTDHNYQVFCGYAAETLGFRFLPLGKPKITPERPIQTNPRG